MAATKFPQIQIRYGMDLRNLSHDARIADDCICGNPLVRGERYCPECLGLARLCLSGDRVSAFISRLLLKGYAARQLVAV
jgi:hypothetical protein